MFQFAIFILFYYMLFFSMLFSSWWVVYVLSKTLWTRDGLASPMQRCSLMLQTYLISLKSFCAVDTQPAIGRCSDSSGRSPSEPVGNPRWSPVRMESCSTASMASQIIVCYLFWASASAKPCKRKSQQAQAQGSDATDRSNVMFEA